MSVHHMFALIESVPDPLTIPVPPAGRLEVGERQCTRRNLTAIQRVVDRLTAVQWLEGHDRG